MAKQIVLQQQNRQGTWISASYLVPNNVDVLRVLGDVSPPDLASAKAFSLTVESSSDGGNTWVSRFGFNFVGPMIDQPYVEVEVSPFVGQRVRAVLDIPETMRLGATVEVITRP